MGAELAIMKWCGCSLSLGSGGGAKSSSWWAWVSFLSFYQTVNKIKSTGFTETAGNGELDKRTHSL